MEYDSKKQQIIDKLRQNEYIPHETFEMFVAKKLNKRPGKRIMFSEQVQNPN